MPTKSDLARWKDQARNMDIKQLHWQFGEAIRQASYYRATPKVASFYQDRADFFLDLFQKERAKVIQANAKGSN